MYNVRCTSWKFDSCQERDMSFDDFRKRVLAFVGERVSPRRLRDVMTTPSTRKFFAPEFTPEPVQPMSKRQLVADIKAEKEAEKSKKKNKSSSKATGQLPASCEPGSSSSGQKKPKKACQKAKTPTKTRKPNSERPTLQRKRPKGRLWPRSVLCGWFQR